MQTSILENILLDQKKVFTERSDYIKREVDFARYKQNRQIIVISGVRRCGKSTLLRQFAALYEDFHYINFDDERLVDFEVTDFAELMILFRKCSDAKVIFIDEIQNIQNWERFVRRVHDEGYKLFITGSNSRLLSSELGTHLTGRYSKIELFPFSFREFLIFNKVDSQPLNSEVKALLIKSFDQYLENGGFPEFLKYSDREFLSRTYEDIIYRDIVARHNIRDTRLFLQLSHYLFSNFTGDLNYNTIKKALGFKSPVSVKNYIGFLEDSYLAFELYKHDYSLKKQHVNDKKLYVIDNGMRNEVSFRFSGDLGKLLENLVFVELLRKQRSLYMHKGKFECDFIIQDRTKINSAIQVCYALDERNRQREIGGLVEASQRYGLEGGLILTYNQSEETVVDNIRIQLIPVWKWLLTSENTP